MLRALNEFRLESVVRARVSKSCALSLSQHERANNIHAPLYALCNTIVLINTKRYMLLVFTYNQNYTRSAVNVHMRGAKWDERVFGPGVDFNGRAGGCRRKKWHRMRAKNTSSAPLQCYVVINIEGCRWHDI